MFAEVGEHAGDQLFESVAATEDLGASECAAGEVGLERLDEPTFVVSLKIVLNGSRASPRVRSLYPAGLLTPF
jgi:hypothetical protein